MLLDTQTAAPQEETSTPKAKTPKTQAPKVQREKAPQKVPQKEVQALKVRKEAPVQMELPMVTQGGKPRGPKPLSQTERTHRFLQRQERFGASSYEVAHLLDFTGPWAPQRAIVILERLVREGRAGKVKVRGETRYIIEVGRP